MTSSEEIEDKNFEKKVEKKFTAPWMNKAMIKELFDPLWHYTSVDTFQSILNSKAFHATRFMHMNDPHEFKHGVLLEISWVLRR